MRGAACILEMYHFTETMWDRGTRGRLVLSITARLSLAKTSTFLNSSRNFHAMLVLSPFLSQKFDGTVYTFGFGSDHDSTLLEAISTQGGGVYYYIDSHEKVSGET